MDEQTEALNLLLRCQLTAVNQQFTHVLALRAWGEAEIAERIMEVDMIDFPNAMGILDHLVATGTPLALAPDPFAPGQNATDVLRAEQAVERRLGAALAGARVRDRRARQLVATAQEPRQAYAEWLAERLSHSAAGPSEPAGPDGSDLAAHLIAMIEQTLVHAFVHRHAGDGESADAAWAASGGAMMQLTELVHLFAARRRVPVPGRFPALRIAAQPMAALEADGGLAALVAEAAAGAAGRDDQGGLADLCRRIANYSVEQSRWRPGQAHPAGRTNPPAFASFAATLERFDIAVCAARLDGTPPVRRQ